MFPNIYDPRRRRTAAKGYSDNCPQLQLAQAYIPFQQLNYIYQPEVALEKGTVFPELYMPYESNAKNY